MKRNANELLDREPPSDRDAERMTLRAILLSSSLIDEAGLTADLFHDRVHRTIFAAIATLREHLQPIDMNHLHQELIRTSKLSAVGGAKGLAELLDSEPMPSLNAHYIAAVKEQCTKRRLLKIGIELIQGATSRTSSLELMDRLESSIGNARADAELHRHGARLTVVPLSTIKSERLEWLWESRFPLGKHSLLIGDPGDGKSLLAIDMASRVSRNAAWPCGTGLARLGRVLLICCEDDAGDTIRPRLEAAGADMSNIDLLQGVSFTDPETGKNRERLLNLQTDIGLLGDQMVQGGYCLVILDTLTGFIGRADNNSSTEIRNALTPLSVLAAEHRAAIVSITHLTKNNSTAARYRTNGSVAYNALARSVMAVARDHQAPDLRLFAGVKANLGPAPATLGFKVLATNGVPHIEWQSHPIDITAEEMLAPPKEQKQARRNEAVTWLSKFLEGGPRPKNDLLKAALETGLSERTVTRAKDRLGIKVRKTGLTGGWIWFLSHHEQLANTWQPSKIEGCQSSDEDCQSSDEDCQSSDEDCQSSDEDCQE